MLQPLFAPLQYDIRFFLVPIPATPWADFAACCPRREQYRVSTFRLQKYIGLAACYRPGGLWVTKSAANKRYSHLLTILVQALKPFPLVISHDLYRRFTCVQHTDYLALIRRMATRRIRLLRVVPHTLRCFATLLESLFIQTPRFKPGDTGGSIICIKWNNFCKRLRVADLQLMW